jgi:hypothetical protein
MTVACATALTLVALVITGGLLLGGAVADAVRDSDWWVILRGRVTARRDRYRHWREIRR